MSTQNPATGPLDKGPVDQQEHVDPVNPAAAHDAIPAVDPASSSARRASPGTWASSSGR